MATHRTHEEKDCFYFVTFTCYRWLPLLQESNLYDYLPKWTEALSKKGVRTTAYVIMPNHPENGTGPSFYLLCGSE